MNFQVTAIFNLTNKLPGQRNKRRKPATVTRFILLAGLGLTPALQFIVSNISAKPLEKPLVSRPLTAADGPVLSAEDNRCVDEAMSKLTLEEKVAQLTGVRLNALVINGRLSEEECLKQIPHGVGHVSQFSSCVEMRPEELAATVAALQHFITTHNSAGIPAIFHEEAITGFAARGNTTYPQQINMGCTWNTDLVRANAAATARAMRSIGATQALSPMLDVINDARWGRSEEGFGEDPYLTAVMGVAFIRGLQGNDLRHGVAATAKHFAGYGNSPTDLGVFRNEVLLPHDAAVHVAGVSSMMPGYHSYLGEPCASSQLLLNQILRKEWNFNGPIVSDYGSISQIFTQYKKGNSLLDAAVSSLSAGMHVELPSNHAFAALPQAIRDGRVPVSLVDNALRRQLILKARLGLLDPAPAKAPVIDCDSEDNRARAYTAAAQSVVLLKNNGILPLTKSVNSIAVVGPNADSYYSLLGDYTYQMMMEFWWRKPVDPTSPRLVTLLTGLREQLSSSVKISFERGCDWTQGLSEVGESKGVGDPRLKEGKRWPLEKVPPTSAEAAFRLASESDVIIAAMGENRYLCGESVDRADVRLPGEQETFIERLAATGKPLILVVFGGRPMALGNINHLCQAIIYAWYPGQAGGTALADIIRGAVNPAGRLTMTLPCSTEQAPISYRLGYTPEKTPLYPFGYGISYTHFSYGELNIPDKVQTSDTEIPVRFTITNEGNREGTEICQLYLRCTEGISKSGQELKGFARVELPSGKSRTVTINVPLELLGHFSAEGTLTIAPGEVEVLVGASASDIRLRANIVVAGDPVTQSGRIHFFSTATLH